MKDHLFVVSFCAVIRQRSHGCCWAKGQMSTSWTTPCAHRSTSLWTRALLTWSECWLNIQLTWISRWENLASKTLKADFWYIVFPPQTQRFEGFSGDFWLIFINTSDFHSLIGLDWTLFIMLHSPCTECKSWFIFHTCCF